MENKKGIKVIIGIIIILLVIAVGFGIFIFYRNESFENDWAEMYYETLLKDSSENSKTVSDINGEDITVKTDYFKNTNDAKIKFIKIPEFPDPIMAVSYKKNGKDKLSIYVKDNEKIRLPFVDYNENEAENESKMNFSLEYLYDIEKKTYNWYVKQGFEDNRVSYTPINNNVGKEVTQDLMQSVEVYVFSEEDMKTEQTDENGNPKLSRFEEKFIKLDEETNSFTVIGELHNIKKSTLKDYMKNTEKEYEDKEEYVSDKEKDLVESRLNEIQEKKEKIKAIEEEKARKEAEAKAEEEAKKKVEEEAAKGLKVGKFTLKYGKYMGDDFAEGTDRGPSGKATYTINADGTYSFAPTNGEVMKGKYKVVDLSSLGSYYKGMYGLEFSNGGKIGVPANNTLEALAGAGNQFKYVGE